MLPTSRCWNVAVILSNQIHRAMLPYTQRCIKNSCVLWNECESTKPFAFALICVFPDLMFLVPIPKKKEETERWRRKETGRERGIGLGGYRSVGTEEGGTSY